MIFPSNCGGGNGGGGDGGGSDGGTGGEGGEGGSEGGLGGGGVDGGGAAEKKVISENLKYRFAEFPTSPFGNTIFADVVVAVHGMYMFSHPIRLDRIK